MFITLLYHQLLVTRGALDPEFCYPAGSGSWHVRSSRIRIQTRQQERNYSFCTTTRRNWTDCLPVSWPNFYLSDNQCLTLTVLDWNDWVSEFSYEVLCCHASFSGMKECCDVLCHSYVDPASIYRILPQIRPDPDPNRIQIHWIQLDPSWIHQIHRISGWIWIQCTPTDYWCTSQCCYAVIVV